MVHLDRNLKDTVIRICVPAPSDVTFVQFVVQVEPVESDLTLTLNGSNAPHLLPGGGAAFLAFLDNNCTKATPTPTPSPSASSTATPSPSASPVAMVLAQTGGLDLRFPLVGAVLLLLGSSLLLVAASRRRSSSTR